MTEAQDATRKVPMEVLSLGMSRTGTSSMKKALEILGLPCYHAFELYDHTPHCKQWNKALDAKYFSKGEPFGHADWDALLGEYGAVTDVPAIAFADELVETYPCAKVILVERDMDKWWESFDENVAKHLYDFSSNLIANMDPWLLGPAVTVHHRWARGWMGARTREEMNAKSRQHYLSHYENVRKITPKGRLLEYHLGSGWEPLCAFLGKPIPDVPFPKVNESAAMEEKINSEVRRGMRSIGYHALLFALPFISAGVAWWWYTY